MHQNLLSQEEQQISMLLCKGRKLHTLPELKEAAFPALMKGTTRSQQQISQAVAARCYSQRFPFVEGTETYSAGESLLESVHTALCRLSPISLMGSALWCTLWSQTYPPVSSCLFVPQDQGLRHPNSEKKVLLSTTGPERLHLFSRLPLSSVSHSSICSKMLEQVQRDTK